jgi:hypothetical protein
MGNLWWDFPRLPPLHDPWIRARKNETEEESSSSCLSSRMCFPICEIKSTCLRPQWLLSREQRGRFDPRYRDPDPVYYEYRPEQHGMHTFPPPVYDPSLVPPPTYQPPAGGTKTDPSQRLSEPVSRPGDLEQGMPEYEPPVGPPQAAALRQDQTGSSTTSNNPYKFWKRSAR